ncbi:hypothetical protein T439DRAFT_354410 [Meredithblackwellia eburnea MCA 4105]
MNSNNSKSLSHNYATPHNFALLTKLQQLADGTTTRDNSDSATAQHNNPLLLGHHTIHQNANEDLLSELAAFLETSNQLVVNPFHSEMFKLDPQPRASIHNPHASLLTHNADQPSLLALSPSSPHSPDEVPSQMASTNNSDFDTSEWINGITSPSSIGSPPPSQSSSQPFPTFDSQQPAELNIQNVYQSFFTNNDSLAVTGSSQPGCSTADSVAATSLAPPSSGSDMDMGSVAYLARHDDQMLDSPLGIDSDEFSPSSSPCIDTSPTWTHTDDFGWGQPNFIGLDTPPTTAPSSTELASLLEKSLNRQGSPAEYPSLFAAVPSGSTIHSPILGHSSSHEEPVTSVSPLELQRSIKLEHNSPTMDTFDNFGQSSIASTGDVPLFGDSPLFNPAPFPSTFEGQEQDIPVEHEEEEKPKVTSPPTSPSVRVAKAPSPRPARGSRAAAPKRRSRSTSVHMGSPEVDELDTPTESPKEEDDEDEDEYKPAVSGSRKRKPSSSSAAGTTKNASTAGTVASAITTNTKTTSKPTGKPKRVPNGIREGELLDEKAPIQARHYRGDSSTARKEVPKAIARNARAAGKVLEEEDGTVSLDGQLYIEEKRKQNTLAARESRARKKAHIDGLEMENAQLKAQMKEKDELIREQGEEIERMRKRIRLAGLDKVGE